MKPLEEMTDRELASLADDCDSVAYRDLCEDDDADFRSGCIAIIQKGEQHYGS